MIALVYYISLVLNSTIPLTIINIVLFIIVVIDFTISIALLTILSITPTIASKIIILIILLLY